MGIRLQKLDERKGEIIRSKVEELFNKANTAIDCFSSPPKENEVREVESLLEGARSELKELSESNDETMRTGLLAKFNDLKKKLEPYKDNDNDSQQATATNSEVKNSVDPLKKEFDDYWTEYGHKSKDLEEQVLRCQQAGQPREQLLGKMRDLKEFYEDSLKKARSLRLEKFVGKPAYDNEKEILTTNIDHIRTVLRALEEAINKLMQDDQETRKEKQSGCKQS